MDVLREYQAYVANKCRAEPFPGCETTWAAAEPDARAVLAACESLVERRWLSLPPGVRSGYAHGIAYILWGANFNLISARQGEPEGLRSQTAHWRRYAELPSPMLDDDIRYCFHRVAVERYEGAGPATPPRFVTTVPEPARSAPVPSANVVPAGMPPMPAARRIEGASIDGFRIALGVRGNAAVDRALLRVAEPAPSPEQVMAQRRAAASAAEREAFRKMRSRTVHNRANDATACLKVEPTGVTNEWGIQGRYRLVNRCGHPVEASWCANAAECSSGRGSQWTIRPNGDYPIFFGDPTRPTIEVGGCKAGPAKEPPLAQQPGIDRIGLSEAREMPVPAPGVSLLANHRCD